MKKILQGVFVCVLCWMSVQTHAENIEKINVGIGYLEVTNTGVNANKARFNLTLQEKSGVTPPAYPYIDYSSDCPDGITQDISSDAAVKNMLFSVLLAAKQGQNYVDVIYEKTTVGEVVSCALEAITIKYKQN